MKPKRPKRRNVKPIKTDVLKIEDLRPEMILMGTVRNVVDFGAFVDIGVGQMVLFIFVELSEKYVRRPMDVVSLGEQVKVRILDVD